MCITISFMYASPYTSVYRTIHYSIPCFSLRGVLFWVPFCGHFSWDHYLFSHSAAERLWGSPIIWWILQWNVNKGKNTYHTVFMYYVSLSFSKNVQLFILYLNISSVSWLDFSASFSSSCVCVNPLRQWWNKAGNVTSYLGDPWFKPQCADWGFDDFP